MALAQYTLSEVLDAATEFRASFTSGELNAHEYRAGLCGLQFRDGSGNYWALDGLHGCWYRFDDRHWSKADRAPDRLEGPDWLMAFRTLAQHPEPPDTARPDPAQTKPAVRVLAEVVSYLRQEYAQGSLSSAETQALLAQQYLLDAQGRAWTVGVRSDKWYHFENGGWLKADQPPSEETLARLAKPETCDACGAPLHGEATCPHCATRVAPGLIGLTEDSYPAVLEFLVAGAGTVPERLTDPWQPPAWFPEAMHDQGLTCISCSATNPPASLYCNLCGAPFPVPSPVAPQEKVCPMCKTVAKPGKKFCVRCGAPLTVPADQERLQ